MKNKKFIILPFLIIIALFLIIFVLFFSSCNYKIFSIKTGFKFVPGIENIRVENSGIEDKCWMKATVHVKNKGDVIFDIRDNSWRNRSNFYTSFASFPDENVRIYAFSSLKEWERSNKEDYWLAGKYVIPDNYKILPFEIKNISDIVTHYDDIMKFRHGTKEPGLNRESIPTEKYKYYFIVTD